MDESYLAYVEIAKRSGIPFTNLVGKTLAVFDERVGILRNVTFEGRSKHYFVDFGRSEVMISCPWMGEDVVRCYNNPVSLVKEN